MTALMVDAEAWVATWLETQTAVITVTETPAALTPPLLHVVRIGGPDDGLSMEFPTVSIHAFGVDRHTAKALALTARHALYSAIGQTWQGAVCVTVRTLAGPAWTPYDNTTLRRVTGTYRPQLQTA